MSNAERGHGHRKPWAQRSAGSKALVIAALVVGVPALITAFGLVTMALWNWLMPAIFGLGRIGLWQALGLLLLSQILFKGGVHRAARGHWRRRQIWEHMHEEGAEGRTATI